jgi:hypothetical protein
MWECWRASGKDTGGNHLRGSCAKEGNEEVSPVPEQGEGRRQFDLGMG